MQWGFSSKNDFFSKYRSNKPKVIKDYFGNVFCHLFRLDEFHRIVQGSTNSIQIQFQSWATHRSYKRLDDSNYEVAKEFSKTNILILASYFLHTSKALWKFKTQKCPNHWVCKLNQFNTGWINLIEVTVITNSTCSCFTILLKKLLLLRDKNGRLQLLNWSANVRSVVKRFHWKAAEA